MSRKMLQHSFFVSTLVKNVRKELNESQEQFGKRFETSQDTISRIELGKLSYVPINLAEFLIQRVWKSYERHNH